MKEWKNACLGLLKPQSSKCSRTHHLNKESANYEKDDVVLETHTKERYIFLYCRERV